jgi:hypothetical protein
MDPMSNMNARDRIKNYRLLKVRDGEKCFICRRPARPQKKLVIDHWDNDNSNNDPLNLHLMCQPDNIKKNPRGKGKKMSPVSVSECDKEKINSAEYRKNQEAEPRFRHWVYQELKLKKQIEYDEIINSGAEVVDISQETAKRYLKKLCSEAGPMQLMKDESDKKYVVLKSPKKMSRIDIQAGKNNEVQQDIRLVQMKYDKKDKAVGT